MFAFQSRARKEAEARATRKAPKPADKRSAHDSIAFQQRPTDDLMVVMDARFLSLNVACVIPSRARRGEPATLCALGIQPSRINNAAARVQPEDSAIGARTLRVTTLSRAITWKEFFARGAETARLGATVRSAG
jgi:hypothetical protein